MPQDLNKARRIAEKAKAAPACRQAGKPAVFAPVCKAGAKRQAAKAYCARTGATAEAAGVSAAGRKPAQSKRRNRGMNGTRVALNGTDGRQNIDFCR